jgi:succinylarginine dihydrolase
MYGAPGVELFVYGREGARQDPGFPARQTRAASEAIARLHGLRTASTVFAQQHPDAISQGAFHNDVVAVGNLQTLFTHELALADQAQVIEQLREALAGVGGELRLIEIPEAEVPLAAAVSSYLFNSQLLENGDGTVILLAPSECRETPEVWSCLERLMQEGAFHEVITLDLRQSMRNGGGPACLRLRVVLSDEERAAAHAPCWFSPKLHETLEAWVRRHYREELRPEDLADPLLLEESRRALDELSGILALGRIYPFQQ